MKVKCRILVLKTFIIIWIVSICSKDVFNVEYTRNYEACYAQKKEIPNTYVHRYEPAKALYSS
ncbi:hypothetical protein SBF1_780005 [Candidatus Desulfosporosinus infrequens]|uniref:Uncharacterized protein n=1 Tax=Candidatus Desulfosporosinus infrequens TaxID=2043169 RepID=A0A2U3LRW6_9FIRM|nr:hypothetical protein SBF1_780005 [Candidatus Desulfosporosinus infrequens]